MDSHQRRRLAREMRRLGLGQIREKILAHPDEKLPPKLKWQDALTVVGALLGVVGWVDMPVYFRIACLALCPIFLIVSFWSHKNWLPLWRGFASLVVIAFGVVAIFVVVHNVAATLTLGWNNPASIEAGAPLSALQLNAVALSEGKGVNGDYIYEPTFNATLPVGTQTLHVTFIPKDPRFPSREKTVAIAVLESPVEISPPQVVFGQIAFEGGSGKIPSQFSQQYTFRITNTTARDIYSIGAELKIKSDRLSIDEFNLGIPKSSWKPLNDVGLSGNQSGDMMAQGIRNKQTDKSFFVVELAHLEPHESREITIWESDAKGGRKDTATVTAAIYHSTFEPAPVLRSAKRTMFISGVPFPEGGILEKVSLLILP